MCIYHYQHFFSHITMVNYQDTVLLDRLLSNGLAILSANYYYIHTMCVCVCASRNNSDKTVHMHRQINFLLLIYSMSGNFS